MYTKDPRTLEEEKDEGWELYDKPYFPRSGI